MRSRSTCDGSSTSMARSAFLFQSQMRSRSTCDLSWFTVGTLCFLVSISDEKPLHMRHSVCPEQPDGGIVSISDEKPLHMRLIEDMCGELTAKSFNLR